MYRSLTGGDYPQDMSLPILTYPRAGQLPVTSDVTNETVESLKAGLAVPKPNSDDKVRIIRPAKLRRRPKPAKVDKGDGPKVDAPLSELTKNMPHIPIRDMEAWVNRSAETRLKEVKMKNGKIARPMNSFMLYRSAYAERTKQWCAQNNHQVVSRASGQSWPLEPREIRDRYERYATIERDNHHKAHPDYKFAPNKNQNTPKQQSGAKNQTTPTKRKRSHEEELSDFEDQGLDITSYPRQANRRRAFGPSSDVNRSRTSTPGDDSTYESRHPTPMGHTHADMYQNGDANRSSWEMINPGRPHPGILSPPQQTHYYQPSIHQSLLGSNIEDVTYKKIGIPGGVNYEAAGPMTSMPGNPHPELLQPQPLSHNRLAVSMSEVQVDPQLLAFDQSHTPLPADNNGGFGGQTDFWQFPPSNNNYVHGYMSGPETDQYHHAALPPSSMAGLMTDREMWGDTQGLPPPTCEELNEWFSGSTVN
ncbi:HMG box protein [Arthroderma uncinatum]|uniref:HMG box protein n=1 Tax=Arthroderma uncinatum TaxID=74035 RepID=UPI00144AB747|nr:HMG box protein [Arthroderma uncinatum]KAF3480239.1 HMG box protein [Arthroderma uncinatum]